MTHSREAGNTPESNREALAPGEMTEAPKPFVADVEEAQREMSKVALEAARMQQMGITKEGGAENNTEMIEITNKLRLLGKQADAKGFGLGIDTRQQPETSKEVIADVEAMGLTKLADYMKKPKETPYEDVAREMKSKGYQHIVNDKENNADYWYYRGRGKR
jgi:hypothetical protein